MQILIIALGIPSLVYFICYSAIKIEQSKKNGHYDQIPQNCPNFGTPECSLNNCFGLGPEIQEREICKMCQQSDFFKNCQKNTAIN